MQIGGAAGALGAVGTGQEVDGGRRIGGIAKDGPSFADTLKEALGDVSQLQVEQRDAIGAYLRGEPIEIVEVMTAVEKAGISLEMLVEVRNKLTEAYRSVIQMQA